MIRTKIHSQYCTNPIWISAAIANPSLFNLTLFACAIHEAALRGNRESPESIYYKTETIRILNDCLDDPELALADETLAAVLLLTHIVVSSTMVIKTRASTRAFNSLELEGHLEPDCFWCFKYFLIRGTIWKALTRRFPIVPWVIVHYKAALRYGFW